MGSQNWWFGDPKPLQKTHPKPSLLQGSVILRVRKFYDFTPLKINTELEHNHGGLEDHFPF